MTLSVGNILAIIAVTVTVLGHLIAAVAFSVRWSVLVKEQNRRLGELGDEVHALKSAISDLRRELAETGKNNAVQARALVDIERRVGKIEGGERQSDSS